MSNSTIKKLEIILKELSTLEKKGLDTSSLRLFIKDLKEFTKFDNQPSLFDVQLSFDEKLSIIKEFLEDKIAFPTINEVIYFANKNLGIEFKNQKKSRPLTIELIISKIRSKPELKDVLKKAVISIRNENVHKEFGSNSQKEIISAATFSKWAEIIKNI